MANHDSIFLTTKEVSKYLGVPLRTIYRLAEQKKINSIRIGGKLRFFKDDIEKHYYLGTSFLCKPHRKIDEVIERRAFPRINTNLVSQYSISLPPFKNITAKGIIRNISANGIFLIAHGGSAGEIQIDDPIVIIFELITKDKVLDIEFEAKVVRKINNGLGIKFRDIKDEYRKAIVEYVG